MDRLNEIRSIAVYLGETLNMTRAAAIFERVENESYDYPDCDCYRLSPHSLDSDLKTDLLRLIPTLSAYWKNNDMELVFTIHVQNSTLIGGHIDKWKYVQNAGGAGQTQYATNPTQQELRLIRRILDFIIVKEIEK